MGIDIGQLVGDAEDAVSQGMSDLTKQGGNAALGYLEGQAIAVIQADQVQHNDAAKQATADMLARPTTPNSFGAYFSNLASQPIIQQYGLYILGAVAVIVGITVFVKGK